MITLSIIIDISHTDAWYTDEEIWHNDRVECISRSNMEIVDTDMDGSIHADGVEDRSESGVEIGAIDDITHDAVVEVMGEGVEIDDIVMS